MAGEALKFQNDIQTEARQGRRIIAIVIESCTTKDVDKPFLMRTYFSENCKCLKVTAPSETARIFNLQDFPSTNLGVTLFISTTEQLPAVHKMIDSSSVPIRQQRLKKTPARITDDTGASMAAAGVSITPPIRQQLDSVGYEFRPKIKYVASFINAQSRFGHEHIRP